MMEAHENQPGGIQCWQATASSSMTDQPSPSAHVWPVKYFSMLSGSPATPWGVGPEALLGWTRAAPPDGGGAPGTRFA